MINSFRNIARGNWESGVLKDSYPKGLANASMTEGNTLVPLGHRSARPALKDICEAVSPCGTPADKGSPLGYRVPIAITQKN